MTAWSGRAVMTAWSGRAVVTAWSSRAVVTAWTGLWLMVFSLLSATALPLPGGDATILLGGDATMVVCTGSGMIDLTQTSDHAPGTTLPLCQMCLPMLQGGTMPAMAATLADPADVAISADTPAPIQAARLSRRHGVAAPRAPPGA